MLCNQVTWLAGLISATGLCSQFMMVKLTLIWLFFYEAWFHLHRHVSTQNNQYWSSGKPHLIHKVRLHDMTAGVWCKSMLNELLGPYSTRKQLIDRYDTYLNSIESVCMYRDIIFITSYNVGKFILFLWSDTWLITVKSCSAWWWDMQFLLEAWKWQLCSTCQWTHCIIFCGLSDGMFLNGIRYIGSNHTWNAIFISSEQRLSLLRSFGTMNRICTFSSSDILKSRCDFLSNS
jgi:hypothetical protein